VPKIRLTRKETNSQEYLDEFLHPDLIANERLTIQKFNVKEFKRGLGPDEVPYPVSPRIGPYVIHNPVFGAKNYYYCNCGMSKNQPFCDSTSHKGSLFKPLKFSLDEKVSKMYMCGCKLTTQAPFCDGVTCACILKGEELAPPLHVEHVETEEEEDDSAEVPRV